MLSALLTAILLILCVLPASAASNDTITECLDVSLLNTDLKGPGYTWDNIECIFVMDGLKINTTDQYGIKLPTNSKIELKGNNTITTSAYGIHCLSNLEFYGNGTLTIVAPEAAIICVSTAPSDNVRFKSGTITASGTKIGVFSENAKLSFTGAKLTVDASVNSIFGNNVQMTGGKLELKGGIYAKTAVSITDTTLSVTSSSKAIDAKGGVSMTGKSILAGESEATLSTVTEYDGQACLRITPQGKKSAPSLLFGEGVSPVFDYVVFALIVTSAVAAVAIPVAIKYKKTAKLIAMSEAAKSEKSKKGNK